MTGAIHTALVAALQGVLGADSKPIYKTVALWNNQPEHELQNENDQKPYLKPACFIEYADIQQVGQNIQKKVQKEYRVILHIIYELLKDNDIAFLDTKQRTYVKIQWFEASTTSKFQWQGEEFPYDYPNLREVKQIYKSVLTDFDAVNAPITMAPGTLTINSSFGI